ncbi:unnamed protein product [Hymenolepis diminuta]|uniref:RING-type E3 ubiquitin transferase n=1 Tax=Hymenolepis diminuta TaxID=6216 RepID=A0A564Z9X7_HYMDI|nr:unnamed protein product [Hymenolepis diminuta]
MFSLFEDIFLTHFIYLPEISHEIIISTRTDMIQSIDEHRNLNRTRRRLQEIDAGIRRPSTPPFTSSYSLSRRAIQCINTLPVSTVRIKKQLVKQSSPSCNVASSGENLESVNDFLLEYEFYPDRKCGHKLYTLIPSQPVVVKSDDHKPECDICLSNYKCGQKVLHLPCGHMFHRSCIDKWLAKAETCPKCRKNVVNTLRLLLSREGENTRTHSQSSLNLPPSPIPPPVNFTSVDTERRQNIPASVVVRHNRTSTLRLELARNRRATNIELDRATYSRGSPCSQPGIISNILRQTLMHNEENPSASTPIVPSSEANGENSICNEVIHSANSKGDETSKRDSTGEPRQKAAEAAMQRYEQFRKKAN